MSLDVPEVVTLPVLATVRPVLPFMKTVPVVEFTAPAIEMPCEVVVIVILPAALTEPVELTVWVLLLIRVMAPVVEASAPETVRVLSVRRLIAPTAVKFVTELKLFSDRSSVIDPPTLPVSDAKSIWFCCVTLPATLSVAQPTATVEAAPAPAETLVTVAKYLLPDAAAAFAPVIVSVKARPNMSVPVTVKVRALSSAPLVMTMRLPVDDVATLLAAALPLIAKEPPSTAIFWLAETAAVTASEPNCSEPKLSE